MSQCPNVWVRNLCKVIVLNDMERKSTVSDLNSVVASGQSRMKGVASVFRLNHFLSAHAVSPMVAVSGLCCSIPRRSQGQKVQVYRPFSRDGFCTTDLPREPQGYRSMPPGDERQALPHGYPKHHLEIQFSQREQHTRLADLCRLRPGVDARSRQSRALVRYVSSRAP